MRGAAHLITVSANYTENLRLRHPALRAMPATELPFGSPDPDLQLAASRLTARPPLLPAGGLRLGFAGALGPGMLAAVEVLFAAMAAVRKDGLRMSAHFFGTSYSPAAQGRPATLALAAQYGLSDCVHEQTDRLPYFDALQVTLEADANLLFGSTDLAFTPSKILVVLAAGRPVVALAPAGSAMVDRLAQLGQDCVAFTGPGPDADGVAATVRKLRALAAGPGPAPDPAALVRYSASAVAERQMQILTSTISSV
jgi:hypothetical protein